MEQLRRDDPERGGVGPQEGDRGQAQAGGTGLGTRCGSCRGRGLGLGPQPPGVAGETRLGLEVPTGPGGVPGPLKGLVTPLLAWERPQLPFKAWFAGSGHLCSLLWAWASPLRSWEYQWALPSGSRVQPVRPALTGCHSPSACWLWELKTSPWWLLCIGHLSSRGIWKVPVQHLCCAVAGKCVF